MLQRVRVTIDATNTQQCVPCVSLSWFFFNNITIMSVDKKNHLDATFVLSFIYLLQVAQHVSGNHVPIIRSCRLRNVIATCWYCAVTMNYDARSTTYQITIMSVALCFMANFCRR